MKVGFVGTGRMGRAMARRLIEANHDVAVFNRTAAKAAELVQAGARSAASLAHAARHGEAVFSMLADDTALDDVAGQKGGLLEVLPKGGIHICSGTHGIGVIRKLKVAHAARGLVPPGATVILPDGDYWSIANQFVYYSGRWLSEPLRDRDRVRAALDRGGWGLFTAAQRERYIGADSLAFPVVVTSGGWSLVHAAPRPAVVLEPADPFE